jgi:hypothetical protein
MGRSKAATALTLGANVPAPVAPRLQRAAHCRPADRAAPRAQATRTATCSSARSRCWTRARGRGARRGCRRARSQAPSVRPHRARPQPPQQRRPARPVAAPRSTAAARAVAASRSIHAALSDRAARRCRRARRSRLPHASEQACPSLQPRERQAGLSGARGPSWQHATGLQPRATSIRPSAVAALLLFLGMPAGGRVARAT